MSKHDLTATFQGINKLIKLTPLRSNPREIKYIQDEFDALFALEIVMNKITDSISMIDKTMYKGSTTFDFIDDIKRDLAEIYLTGRDERDFIIARKKYGALYHLVIVPFLEAMRVYSHREALQVALQMIEEVQGYIMNNNLIVHYDDAIVMQAIVNGEIRLREEERRANLRKRKRRVKNEEVVEETDNLELA